MSIFNKKVLGIIVYYTLIALAVCASGFFVFALVVNTLPLWIKIIYYVWVGLLVGAIIFDIVCTNTHQAKTLSGFIIYVLSVLCVSMSMLVYCLNTTTAGIAAEFFNTYLAVSIISFIATGYAIATWCVGECVVKHATEQEEIDKMEK